MFVFRISGGAAAGEIVVIEFIEQRPLLMALPGMASRFHKYYQYTPQELMDLQKKRKAHEQGGVGSTSSSGDGAGNQDSSSSNSSIAAAGAGAGAVGGGMIGGTSAGQASYPAAAASYAPVMPLQEAVARPFGEAFLWAAGWDPRHPPLGGKPPKTSRLLTSNHHDWRRARANNSHSGGWQERYSYSPATLVAEAVREYARVKNDENMKD